MSKSSRSAARDFSTVWLAGLAAGLVWSRAEPARGAERAAPASEHRIAIDARGPLALVEVTRTLVPEPSEGGGAEAVLDVALPDGAALSSVEVRDGVRWRALETTAAGSATQHCKLLPGQAGERIELLTHHAFEHRCGRRYRLRYNRLRLALEL